MGRTVDESDSSCLCIYVSLWCSIEQLVLSLHVPLDTPTGHHATACIPLNRIPNTRVRCVGQHRTCCTDGFGVANVSPTSIDLIRDFKVLQSVLNLSLCELIDVDLGVGVGVGR